MSNVPRIKFSIDTEDDNAKAKSGTLPKPPRQFGIGRWITYINSAEYQRITPGDEVISESELSRHRKMDDMWMALNHEGKRAVFDITPFACCHPGGLDVLLEHAGTDASEAFRMAHAYVNVDMIGRLRKGFLKRSRPGVGGKPNQLLPSMIVSRASRQQQVKPKWKWVVTDTGTVELIIQFPKFTPTDRTWSCLDRLRVLAYWVPAAACSEASNVVQRGQLLVRTLLDENYHRIELRLVTTLRPCLSTVRLNRTDETSSTETCEAQLTIQLESVTEDIKEPLSTIGSVMADSLVPMHQEADVNLNQTFFQCTVIESRQLIGTPYRFLRISWSIETASISVPLGHHVMLRLPDSSGQLISRPYTPVWSHMNSDTITDLNANLACCTELSFLVKIYPDGMMSQLIDQLKEGDLIETSLPMGQFPCGLMRTILSPKSSTNGSTVFMLAAGSGITPMLRFLPVLLATDWKSDPNSREFDDSPHPTVRLVCFDRTEADQVLVSELADLQSQFPERLFVRRVLSNPKGSVPSDNSWLIGTVGESVCRSCLLPNNLTQENEAEIVTSAFWFICGPPGFNKAATVLTHQWHVPETNVLVFKG